MQRILSYDFYIEARHIGDRLSHHAKVEDDIITLAVDDTLFSALCTGKLLPGCQPRKAIIEPVWGKDKATTPYVQGLNVTICWNGEDGEVSYTRQYDRSPFHTRARQLIAALLREQLKAANEKDADEGVEERFVWMVLALQKPAVPPTESPRKFSAEVVDNSFPVQRRPLKEFQLAWPEESTEPFVVFVASDVIREIQQRTIETGGRTEQAGVLIGHLAQDIESARTFAVVTAHLEATVSVEAEEDSFKFTAETFIEIHRLIRLRQSGEIVLGWQHSHHYCPGCPNNSSGPTIFFSSPDITVQSAAFRSPYMVALVAGRDLEIEADRPAVRMYGWINADMKPRQFIPCEPRIPTEAQIAQPVL